MLDRLLAGLNQDRIVALAREIVAIPSVTNAEQAMSDYTASFLGSLGYTVTRLPVPESGDTIVATYGTGDQAVMLNFHLDTFDVFAGWQTDPFEPVTVGDRLYGLGAHDMKGGAACVLAIAEAIVRSGVTLPGRVIISATSDEENWSRGAHVMIDSGLLDGCVAALVPEPAAAATLTVGQRGRHVFRVRFNGKTVHAAFGGGINAAADAARFVAAVEEPEHVDLGWSEPFGLAGTLNVIGIHSGGTMILVPEVADVWIDRHILPGETLAHARHQIETVLKEVVRHSTWELFVDERPTPAPGPYIVPESSSLVQAMRTAIAIEYDSPVTLVLGRSVADTSHIAFHGGIPTVICGPQGGNTCEANEWLDLPSLLPTARAMTRGMVSLLSSPYRTE
jgi:acetylornithine deacetylase/succinyl-diaminopimelate desuccinylase-like protein